MCWNVLPRLRNLFFGVVPGVFYKRATNQQNAHDRASVEKLRNKLKRFEMLMSTRRLLILLEQLFFKDSAHISEHFESFHFASKGPTLACASSVGRSGVSNVPHRAAKDVLWSDRLRRFRPSGR